MSSPHINSKSNSQTQTAFDLHQVLHEIKHYLPSQAPIKEFIHHNTLHAYQHMKFFDAIFKAGTVFGYQITLELNDFRKLYSIGRIKEEVLDRILIQHVGKEKHSSWKTKLLIGKYDVHINPRIGTLRKNWKSTYAIEIEDQVQPILFRIACSYLDQGIAASEFPRHEKGLIASLRELEKKSLVSFFKTNRARKILLDGQHDATDLLKILVGEENYFEQYLFDQQFSHHGWSGLISCIEDSPKTLYASRNCTLEDFVFLELLFELDTLEYYFPGKWRPLVEITMEAPANLFSPVPRSELQEVLILWQHAFEWSYYDEVLAGILQTRNMPESIEKNHSFQAIFCIDERECSLRRHIESVDPTCETLGTPGFFGVEFYFLQQDGLFFDKLCPAPVFPKYLIKETKVPETRGHEFLYSDYWNTYLGNILGSITLGFWALVKTIQTLFFPKMSPAISNAYVHMHKYSSLTIENQNPEDIENGLQIGFTIPEMATRVENVLRSIGLTKHFAPIIYSIAHGSSSANNPHHSAHDCGACSGRPGAVNARVFAYMANHKEVRKILKEKGIVIPDGAHFIGGMHDTAADRIEFYDIELLSEKLKLIHKQNLPSFDRALDLNAKERSRRFSSIATQQPIKKVRNEILLRSVSMFEPRPELGHGTNSLCIIGNRNTTKKLFLDRRAFMNSYDYTQDPGGKILAGVMRPIGLVCGGINLEYYFSRVDNHKFGAGTKLPHNVMGLVGVANSSDGDLRPGLPLQMIEVHDPVRLLIIVEHYPEIVLNAIQSSPEVYEWYKNEWVHILALHPVSNEFYYFRDGAFQAYQPSHQSLGNIEDINTFVENAREMKSNYIVDATEENLPVHILNV